MVAPSYVNDPQIQFISQLLDEIAEGHLLVPRFRRPVVWSDAQRLELMRSVASSTPIGSIFVWRTRRRIAYYEHLGQYRLNLPKDRELYTYLLDGHQRLSTLFGALRAPRQKGLQIERREDDPCWEIHYDLDEEDFFLAEDDRMGGRRLPMDVILDSIEIVRYQRELLAEPDADVLINRLEQLSAAFQRYKIPIIPVVTNDIDQVMRIFQRINSQGTPMSQIHMIHALTWSEDFNLNQRIEEIRGEHLTFDGWEEMADQSILAVCKLLLDLDMHDGSVEVISRALRDRSEILSEAALHLKRAVEFLSEHCGIQCPRLLPYESLLPLLADGLRFASEDDTDIEKRLVYWFWWTTYIGFAGGSNTSRIRRAGEIVRSLACGEKAISEVMRSADELPPPPRRYDFRHARSKTLALRMAEHREKCLPTSEILMALNLQGAGMIQMLVPRSQARMLGSLEEDRLDNLLRSYANRMVASSEEASSLWREVLDGTLDESVREAHLIPSGEPQNTEELVEFLEQRRQKLEELERKFSAELGILAS